MARIEGIGDKQANLFTRTVYGAVRRKIGRVPEPMRITAHQPRLMGCDSHRLRHAPNLPPHRPVNRAREQVSLLIADSLDACHTSILLEPDAHPPPPAPGPGGRGPARP